MLEQSVRAQSELVTAAGKIGDALYAQQADAPRRRAILGGLRFAAASALVAAFDGKHGWFWRNRSSSEITITLKTSGDYEQIKRVI